LVQQHKEMASSSQTKTSGFGRAAASTLDHDYKESKSSSAPYRYRNWKVVYILQPSLRWVCLVPDKAILMGWHHEQEWIST
jgi:hypothetical protein